MDDTPKYQKYITPSECGLNHQILIGKLDLVSQKYDSLEDRVDGIEHRIDARLDAMDIKIDKLLGLQEKLNAYLLYLAIGVILTLVGVITGRALDFGWLI